MFAVDELLLLEHLTYFPDKVPFQTIPSYEGMTVAQVIKGLDLSMLSEDESYGFFLQAPDWRRIIAAIASREDLMQVKIAKTHVDHAQGGGGGISAVFISEVHQEAVVAFRGTAPGEWLDDLLGAAVAHTPQQVNALNWYRRGYDLLNLSKYQVTVIGHSKGGNKAKYIAIMDDRVSSCVSFDGQGFSDDFILEQKERIQKRQNVIENHNIDYDYVNILLNDIGNCYFYHGYDYGAGGFAESHCPNTFFNFAEDGSYTLRLNPKGQSQEMRAVDRFLNSYIRSMPSKKEREEAAFLLGSLIQKGFCLKGSGDSTADYINFLCEMVSDEAYSDNVAFLFTFMIKYERERPGFMDEISKVLSYFGMNGLIKYIKMVRGLFLFPGLLRMLAIADFMVSHVSDQRIRKIQAYLKKKYDVDMTRQQVLGMLSIVRQMRETAGIIEIKDPGEDIKPDGR